MKGVLFEKEPPLYYPVNAGAAKNAFQNMLTDINRAKQTRLMSQLPNVEDVGLNFIYKWYKHRTSAYKFTKDLDMKIQKEDLQDIEGAVSLYNIKQTSYVATRRNALPLLPGLDSHYPNTLYVDRSIAEHEEEDTFNISANTNSHKKRFSSRIFNLFKKKETPVLEAVGRKRQPKVSNDPVSNRIKNKSPRSIHHDQNINPNKEEIDKTKLEKVKKVNTDSDSKNEPKKEIKVYLKRRGSFPLANGLEDYHNNSFENDTANSNNSDNNNKINQIPIKSASQSVSIKSNFNRDDILRHFTSHGFEIAHQGTIFDAAFSPSETRVASAGADGLIKVWDPRDGSFVYSLDGNSSGTSDIHVYEILANIMIIYFYLFV
jgi:WD40 repeat protein